VTDTTPCGFTEDEWAATLSWDDYLAGVKDKRDLWEANAKRAAVDEVSASRLSSLPGKRRVLVLTEDWCGDAVRSVPLLAKAFAFAPLVEARYLLCDEHPDALTRNLSHGGRAIPMAIVEDEHGRHLGTWGPRPAALQALYRARRREFGPPTPEQMGEFYAPIMQWYAKDGGQAVLDEVLLLLERGGTPR
jgi:hypothetical protein